MERVGVWGLFGLEKAGMVFEGITGAYMNGQREHENKTGENWGVSPTI